MVYRLFTVSVDLETVPKAKAAFAALKPHFRVGKTLVFQKPFDTDSFQVFDQYVVDVLSSVRAAGFNGIVVSTSHSPMTDHSLSSYVDL